MSDIDYIDLKREAMRHNYSASIALTVVLWECLIALKDEVRFIWRCRSQKTKATYLFARYFAIGYLTVNVFLSSRRTSRFPAPQSMCLHWFVQHTTAFCAQYVASHVTLLKRVFDLNHGREVAFTFAAFHLAELAGVIVSSRGSVAAMNFDPACRPLLVSKDAFLFLGFFLSGQSLIWSLIIRRVWQPDGTNSPRLSVRAKLYRLWHEGDGKAAWAVCFFGISFNSIYSYARQQMEPTYLFGWPFALISVATCRYTLSLEKEAYIRSRFSHPSNKGKERAIQPLDDIEDGIEITTTINPAGPSNVAGHHIFARSSQSQNSVLSDDWLHPVGLHSLMSITSTVAIEPTEATLYTSPTNSLVSYERRQSWAASMETQETEQTEITVPSRTDTDIEIGSMHTSSSMNSEELRDFWNEALDGTVHQVGPFIG